MRHTPRLWTSQSGERSEALVINILGQLPMDTTALAPRRERGWARARFQNRSGAESTSHNTRVKGDNITRQGSW